MDPTTTMMHGEKVSPPLYDNASSELAIPSLLDLQDIVESSKDMSQKARTNQTVENLNQSSDVIAEFYRTHGSDTHGDADDINEDLDSKELSASPKETTQHQGTMTSKQSLQISIDATMSSTSERESGGGSVGSRRPLHEEKPRLTLSAYRRPEETVRVADPDTSRKITDFFDLKGGAILGHGAMSTVRLASRRVDGLNVAVKSISKYDVLRSRRLRQSKNRRYLDEWEIIQLLGDNPNVVSLLDVFETDDEVQLILEFCSGGELYSAIERQEEIDSSETAAQRERQASRIASQMLSALDDLHSKGIVHRDVKPENILLTSSSGTDVKLCDFGLARLLVDESDTDSSCSEGDSSPLTPGRRRAFSTVGSDLYAAPEVSTRDGYGTAVDVYSLGVTLYVFICGFPPTAPLKGEAQGEWVAFPGSGWERISESAKDLLRMMLDPEPERRISAEDAFKHSWIVEHAVKETPLPARRPSHIFSPSKPRPSVDMELVRSRLYRNLEDSDSRKRSCKSKGVGRKRRRMSNTHEENYFMAAAMEDLYKGVASAAASATAAAAGVLCDETENIRVVDAGAEEERDEESFGPVTLLF